MRFLVFAPRNGQERGFSLESGPRIVEDEKGRHIWHFEDKVFPYIGLNAVAGKEPSEYGLEPLELGTLAVDGNRLHDAAFAHLQALAAKTGLAAQLAVLDRAEVVYLERIVVGPIRLPTRRGGRNPAYCTALGKALAAYDDDAMHTVLSAPMPRKTLKTITEPVALWTELKRVREDGVAFDRGEAYAELVCVAAPIRSSGNAIAAVSVTGPAGRMRWGVVTEAVRGTAAAIWNANLSLWGAGTRRPLPPKPVS